MPKHDTIRQTVDLNRGDVEWFREHYPKASVSGVLETLFSTFRRVSEKSAKDYIEEAVKRIIEETRQ